ncbi:MAG: PEP-CTERM sorting domain-containing protein [Sphingomonadales bacterium]|jgi:hypothetical protein
MTNRIRTFGKQSLWILLFLLFAVPASAVPSNNVQLRITITNNQTASNSLAFGPVFFGFHDGSFDPFNVGDSGTETNGGPTPFGQAVLDAGSNNFSGLQNLFTQSSPNGGSITYGNARDTNGVFNPNESDNFSVVVDINQNNELFIFTRVLPSTDAFAATDTSLSLANIQQNGSITFQIVSAAIFDAAAQDQFRTEADYVADPGAFGSASMDNDQITPVELLHSNYFSIFDDVILVNGETFLAPDLGIRDFILGTITIEFITTVPEPTAFGISFIGIVGLFAVRKRKKKFRSNEMAFTVRQLDSV